MRIVLVSTYDLGRQLKAVLGARWDDSTLHPSEVSPRASLVWALADLLGVGGGGAGGMYEFWTARSTG